MTTAGRCEGDHRDDDEEGHLDADDGADAAKGPHGTAWRAHQYPRNTGSALNPAASGPTTKRVRPGGLAAR